MRKYAAAAIVLAVWTSAVIAAGETSWRARLATVPIDPATAEAVTGMGEASARLEGETLVVSGTFNGLQGPATAARLHSGSYTGVRGDAFADLTVTASVTGSISGSVELSPDELAALEAGRVYIQIDSEAAPDGNLWGWLLND